MTASPSQSSPVIPPRAAFVVGVARSGTTLLVSLLDGHSELLALPYESKVFDWCGAADPVATLFATTRFGKLFPESSENRATLEGELRRHITGPAHPRAALEALVSAWSATRPVPGATLWVEKTPKHLRSVPVLRSWYGDDTPFICVVRDPRAVYSSQRKRWGRTGVKAAYHFARRWATADSLVHDYEESGANLLVIRYEDLVADSESVMHKVAGHLGITWDAGLLQPDHDWGGGGGGSSFGGRRAGISSTSVDRWIEELPEDEITTIEGLLAPRMARFGYQPRSAGASSSPWSRLRLEASLAWSIRVERRRWRRLELSP
jgi:hypothetical protein